MEILDQDKLILFIAFIMPGFITLKVYNLLCLVKKEELTQQIVDALTYSCISYALNICLIFWVEAATKTYNFPIPYGLFYLYILFIFPAFLGYCWFKIRKTKWFQKGSPHPTILPWDFVFELKKEYWVIVTLNGGKKIAGRYAEGSFTSNYPEEPQIYLIEHWKLNRHGGFERKISGTAGIIVLSKEIESIELFLHDQ